QSHRVTNDSEQAPNLRPRQILHPQFNPDTWSSQCLATWELYGQQAYFKYPGGEPRLIAFDNPCATTSPTLKAVPSDIAATACFSRNGTRRPRWSLCPCRRYGSSPTISG